MDKRSERRWRFRQFKLRSAIFLRKNGLYAMLVACLAILGIAAAFIFSGDPNEPDGVNVDRNQGDTLDDVTNEPYITNSPKLPGKNSPSIGSSGIIDFTPAPSATPEPMPSAITITPPVDGTIIRIYAMDSLVYSKTLEQWMTHCGVDIAAKQGDEVRTIMEGTVEGVYEDDMLGVTVVIAHPNGMKSVYANLKEKPPVSEGQSVAMREVIGYVGTTAISECEDPSHLHFELYLNGKPVNPQDYISFKKA